MRSTGVALTTERLLLRPMTAADFGDLFEIFGDAAVMAAFGETPLTAEQMRSWLERNLAHQREHGYGLFAVCSRRDGRLIGDCGLELIELDGEAVVELGYDFRSDLWNQGYATEAACAVRDYAFTNLRLPRLVSLIQAHNGASARVAEKTGMQRVEQFERYGRAYVRYEIENPI